MTNMSLFAGLVANTNFFFRKLKINLSLDFGSSQTRLVIDRKLVWDQPTLLAWHTHLQVVVAVGDKAEALRGKTPSHIKLISPIQKGIVSEIDYAVYYLKAVLDQLRQQKKLSPWLVANCYLAMPADSSPLEKEQMQQVLDQVGLKIKKIVSKTEAIVSLPIFKKITQSHGVIDFGAQTVDMGIFIGSSLYKSITFSSVVGDVFTQAIIDQILVDHQLHIGWGAAEQIKEQLQHSSVMTIRGKDAQTQLVKVVRVEAKKIESPFFEIVESFLLELKTTIDELPSEIIIQLQEQGFYLTGGGCQLSGWKNLIKASWQMPVVVSPTPTLDVVKGLEHGN